MVASAQALGPTVTPRASAPVRVASNQGIPQGDRLSLTRRDGEAKPEHEDPGSFDLLKFRIWPGAETPVVSAKEDARLGTTGMVPRLLGWIEINVSAKLANGARTLTRVVGPSMFWVSGVANALMLGQTMRDPRYKTSTKVAIGAGTAATFVAAVGATWAAFALKGAMLANKIGDLAGGAAGGIFAFINMKVTLGNKAATPVEKVAATGAFGFAAAGAVLSAGAYFLPATVALGPMGLGIWAAVMGFSSLALGLSQIFLAKNEALNKLASKIVK